VILGAFFVNPKEANHFPDMSHFDMVELWLVAHSSRFLA
jgi:hypothetical protein